MSKNPLELLKSGLMKLKNLTKTKKDDLLACEELLNLVLEEGFVGEISDEEIFQSVMDTHNAEQMMEVNGGDDADVVVDKNLLVRKLLQLCSPSEVTLRNKQALRT